MTSPINCPLSVGKARIRTHNVCVTYLMNTIESCYKLQIMGSTSLAEHMNMILLYDFAKSCTTCLVSANLIAIETDDIAERLSFCFQGRNASDHEGPKKTDPFCLSHARAWHIWLSIRVPQFSTNHYTSNICKTLLISRIQYIMSRDRVFYDAIHVNDESIVAKSSKKNRLLSLTVLRF